MHQPPRGNSYIGSTPVLVHTAIHLSVTGCGGMGWEKHQQWSSKLKPFIHHIQLTYLFVRLVALPASQPTRIHQTLHLEMNFSIKEAGIFLLVFLWPFVGGFSLVRWKASKPLSSTLSSVDDIASYWGVIVVSLQHQ